ncbi:Gfo/Idh/MocA family protein [Tritonibacter horizontis]|uniref:Putative oxidoreductase YdgJ n=1 Tax=Tritonibacter horizontis TaxID=1768241 RepID=A0A132BQU9_9RHOB|nr:Gfo/Idh/MocA family oxidoreductase [Tritonibacter horizontis]KUP90778.1 putative oxidoreductase YdgJ [Tritonibacter horizontis]
MQALLVGCGGMANVWVKAITQRPYVADRVNLVGLVDRSPKTAQDLAAVSGLEGLPIFASVDEAMQSVDCDLVFDVTPPEARASVVRAALIAGKHVLSEKPMANSMAEARELTDLARSSNRLFAVTQNRRYKDGIRRIRAFLDSGALGEVTGIHADFFIGAHFGGFRDQMDHVLLLDMAIHHFDAARFLCGQNAGSVFCQETNPTGSWYAHGASAFAIFEMEHGPFFTYRGSWCAEGKRTSWDAAWRITGTRGTLTWDGLEQFEAHVTNSDEGFLRPLKQIDVPMAPDPRETEDHASVLAAFLDALETGQTAETDSTDNLHSLAMVFGAIESAKAGRKINIAQEITH